MYKGICKSIVMDKLGIKIEEPEDLDSIKKIANESGLIFKNRREESTDRKAFAYFKKNGVSFASGFRLAELLKNSESPGIRKKKNPGNKTTMGTDVFLMYCWVTS